MQKNNINNLINIDDEIDLRELFTVLFQGKWIIIFITFIVSLGGMLYSLQLPNIYHSKALIVPVDSSSGVSGSLGAYSGIAGLAGISLPPSSGETNSAKAIVKLSSLSFFEKNILPYIFLPNLLAVDSWDSKTNTLTYNKNIYDEISNKWVRYSDKQIPSAQESFRLFVSEHLEISEDKKTGFITLAIKHQSPFIAKKWAELAINEINTFYRQKDRLESEKAVSYLNQQIAMTSLAEIKLVIAELLQKETQKLALIQANQSYVFDYIDPPAVMERKSEPARAIICILSLILGAMLSIFIVLTKHYAFKVKAF